MADEIERELGVKPELVESRGGAFEIRRDGSLVFSKLELRRFPEDGEIVRLLRQSA